MDIYLNFDGVLHPDQVFYEDGCIPSLLAPGHNAFEYAELLAMTLEGYEDVVIILNTWWTFYLGLDACKDLLPTALAARIGGSTIQYLEAYDSMPARLKEAECHIARRRSRPWVILDHTNARYRRDFLPHLLLFDPSQGLGNRSAQRSIERRLRLLQTTATHPINQLSGLYRATDSAFRPSSFEVEQRR
ncbi:HAD domain-containing protein [Paraburkholderia caribensis]|uniref:HAD domain-containing protein n=1 Tax=Paraburkholderia caribensis TaxID=75105 RepID=UPI002865312D|nr:HAD domain-containing protein [Paraburkholderia caribensis]MDR6385065.1 hypothetical protein [Paraburkholderia caribensis]